jgi:SAM-dependent methyltransferase
LVTTEVAVKVPVFNDVDEIFPDDTTDVAVISPAAKPPLLSRLTIVLIVFDAVADNTFDFVWSAGVIHHTLDFDKALNELTRVLKPKGKLFLLVYGAGGLRWKAVQALRPIVVDLGMKLIDDAIGLAGLPANNRKHFMDDLFVPIQKLTSFSELAYKLPKLGCVDIDRWTGETFDHESNPHAQLEDIQKLECIARASLGLAKTATEKYLTQLAHATSLLYLDFSERALADKTISREDLREIVIGEGNHRIVTTKI